jgi:hypothetical protein
MGEAQKNDRPPDGNDRFFAYLNLSAFFLGRGQGLCLLPSPDKLSGRAPDTANDGDLGYMTIASV